MIDIFEKVIAEKQTKNLNNVLPPVVNEKRKKKQNKTKDGQKERSAEIYC